ncbi:cupin domain-containing protein [Epibacterium sp. Ofav1-8]|uniref:cupin domain-containing protein n=1 Tax=Epibacterium sp. Ofav1-8 TaxID=2917735 RepID=UPI001EF6F01D|nr:cupin domain-containing protein [Epibacterium sp. Ofav1-8]MCG7625160.1 cupin domain-containing protein [Epibacterium sp. Ofav1-8]
MTDLVLIDDAGEPAINPPFFPSHLGDMPQSRAWKRAVHGDGVVSAGIWESDPGTWVMDYEVWEFCSIISGRCTITPENQGPAHLGPGDSFVCQPGLRGTWTVETPLRKNFVVYRAD